MAEFKKQIGVGVVASVAAAIIVGLLAVNVFWLCNIRELRLVFETELHNGQKIDAINRII